MRFESCVSRVVLGLTAILSACGDELDPLTIQPEPRFAVVGPPAPGPLETTGIGASTITLWPFTGADFQNPVDPVNLVFEAVSPLSLRSALMRLNGDRSSFGFPYVAPFNCVWKDAVGTIQTGYSTEGGWSGSAIQLECGDYGPIRFHIRLFQAGDWTLANAHFEVLIPGTTDHEVLSWELAQLLVTADMVRSGLLDPALPMTLSNVINPAPTYRAINPLVYNGLPASLIALIGGPATPVSSPVPIPSDGRAMIFRVTGSISSEAEEKTNEFTIPFGQVIPKPFCASGPLDFVHVTGPVMFRHTVSTTESGRYQLATHIEGQLRVTPVDPRTSPPTPIGETQDAEILERYNGWIADKESSISMLQIRSLLPTDGALGETLKVILKLGPGGSTDHRVELTCDT